MSAYLEYREKLKEVCKNYTNKTVFSCVADNGEIRRLSFGRLYEAIIDFKSIMEEHNLKAGDRILILDDHTQSVLRTFLCASYWNLTTAIIDVGLPKNEIQYFTDFLDVRAIFTNTKLINKYNEETKKRYPILDIRDEEFRYADISGYTNKGSIEDTVDPDEDVIAIILSSGTTSSMKAVEITYESVMASLPVTENAARYGDNTDALFVFPMSHISGLITSLSFVLGGNTVKMVDTFSPIKLSNLFQAYKPAMFGMVPKVFEIMVQKMQQEIASSSRLVQLYYRFAFKTASFFNRKFGIKTVGKILMCPFSKMLFGGKIRILATGAAPCDSLTAETLINMGIRWIHIYASTEAGIPITLTSRHDKYAIDNVGRVDSNPNAKIIINNPDSDGIGEIYVKTSQIMKGYFREPQLTKEAFDNEYFKTGDLGYIDSEGYLHVTGRAKETILLHTGKKLSPVDLENILLPICNDECELAVCGIADNKTGFDRIHVFIEDRSLTQEKRETFTNMVMEKARKDAPMYPIEQVHFIDKIPKTSVGKVKRYLLVDKIQTSSQNNNQENTIQNNNVQTKDIVLGIIKSFANTDKQIEEKDNLEEIISLDSLVAMEICSMIEDKTGANIEADVMSVKTVEDLIKLVENNKEKKNIDKDVTHQYREPSTIVYSLFKFLSRIVSRFLYHPTVLRNELKDVDGPIVLLANHESALDVVNVVTQYKEKLSIVFGNNYYYSLPRIAQKLADACGVIHKQQFQSNTSDLTKMKEVIKAGGSLLIFPAGLMCEDGLSTPIPEATASFLKWLDTDVYMAKSIGTYFVMPKWSDVKRRGKSKVDIFKAFSTDELESSSEPELREKIDNLLYFDAYEDQEHDRFTYKRGDDTKGLEKVVYQCPVCKTKYSIVSNHNRLSCTACGYTQTMDTMGFLHCEDSKQEVRYVSSWVKWILEQRKQEINEDFSMSLHCEVSVMNGIDIGFRPAGEGKVTLNTTSVILDAIIDGQPRHIEKSVLDFPSLPFVPGKRFEIQDDMLSYRCFPDNPDMVMEWINTLKILHKRAIENE